MSSPSTRGPYAKTAAKRAVIANAALAVVREKGHAGLTTSDVAERAGLSEATMLYHFPTRDHLLVAAAEAAGEESAVAFLASPDRDQHDLSAIPAILGRIGMKDEKVLRLRTFLSAAAVDAEHPAHDFAINQEGVARTALTDMVRAQQERGFASPEVDPDEIARLLVAVWSGLQTMWPTQPYFDLADATQRAFRRLTGQASMEARHAIDEIIARL